MIERFIELATGTGGVTALSVVGSAVLAAILTWWLMSPRTQVQIRFVSPTYHRASRRLDVSISAMIVPPTPGFMVHPRVRASVKVGKVPLTLAERQPFRRQVGGLWMGVLTAQTALIDGKAPVTVTATVRADRGGRANLTERRIQIHDD